MTQSGWAMNWAGSLQNHIVILFLRCDFPFTFPNFLVFFLQTVLLSAIAVIIWFYWSEQDLRQDYTQSGTVYSESPGGRFKLSVSFYCMFAASLMVAVSAALNLLDVCRAPSSRRRSRSGAAVNPEERSVDHRLELGELFSVSRVNDLPPPYSAQQAEPPSPPSDEGTSSSDCLLPPFEDQPTSDGRAPVIEAVNVIPNALELFELDRNNHVFLPENASEMFDINPPSYSRHAEDAPVLDKGETQELTSLPKRRGSDGFHTNLWWQMLNSLSPKSRTFSKNLWQKSYQITFLKTFFFWSFRAQTLSPVKSLYSLCQLVTECWLEECSRQARHFKNENGSSWLPMQMPKDCV